MPGLFWASRVRGSQGALLPAEQCVRLGEVLAVILDVAQLGAVIEVYRAVLDRRDATPGMIAVIHTFGKFLHFHPHLHALVAAGIFAPDGSFMVLPTLDRGGR